MKYAVNTDVLVFCACAPAMGFSKEIDVIPVWYIDNFLFQKNVGGSV